MQLFNIMNSGLIVRASTENFSNGIGDMNEVAINNGIH